MEDRAGLTTERGGAYILALIVMLTVFTMLGAAFHTMSRQVLASRAYRNNANLYELAVSGAEQGRDILNLCLERAYPDISTAALETLRRMDMSETAMYSNGFHLKEPDSGGLRGESDVLFKKIFAAEASIYIEEQLSILFEGEEFSFEYNVEIPEGENVDKYVVYVDISVDRTEIPTVYTVLTYAQNTTTGISTKVVAESVLSKLLGQETFTEGYSWKTIPPWLSTGIVPEYEDWREIWESCGEITEGWSVAHPVLVTSDGEVDISSFYDGGEQVETVVLYTKPDSSLFVTASDPERAEFTGVIISAGEIEFDDVHMGIMGTAAAKGNIILDASFVSVRHDVEALFSVKFFDPADRRRMLDILCLTDFRNMAQPVEYDIENLCSEYIQLHADIIEIQDCGSMRFRIRSLYETD